MAGQGWGGVGSATDRSVGSDQAECGGAPVLLVDLQAQGHRPEQKEAAERWLRSEMAYHGRTYKLGASANFWNSVEPDPLDANSDVGLGGWRWNGELCVAYQATGDARYAEGILTYARAFYHNARPAAKAPDGWTIKYFRGPWHDNWVSTRLQQFLLLAAFLQLLIDWPNFAANQRCIFFCRPLPLFELPLSFK